MHIKNSILVLTKIAPFFPLDHKQGETLERSVADLLAVEKREDLTILAQGCVPPLRLARHTELTCLDPRAATRPSSASAASTGSTSPSLLCAPLLCAIASDTMLMTLTTRSRDSLALSVPPESRHRLPAHPGLRPRPQPAHPPRPPLLQPRRRARGVRFRLAPARSLPAARRRTPSLLPRSPPARRTTRGATTRRHRPRLRCRLALARMAHPRRRLAMPTRPPTSSAPRHSRASALRRRLRRWGRRVLRLIATGSASASATVTYAARTVTAIAIASGNASATAGTRTRTWTRRLRAMRRRPCPRPAPLLPLPPRPLAAPRRRARPLVRRARAATATHATRATRSARGRAAASASGIVCRNAASSGSASGRGSATAMRGSAASSRLTLARV